MSREPLSPDRQPFLPREPHVRLSGAQWGWAALLVVGGVVSIWIGWRW